MRSDELDALDALPDPRSPLGLNTNQLRESEASERIIEMLGPDSFATPALLRAAGADAAGRRHRA